MVSHWEEHEAILEQARVADRGTQPPARHLACDLIACMAAEEEAPHDGTLVLEEAPHVVSAAHAALSPETANTWALRSATSWLYLG